MCLSVVHNYTLCLPVGDDLGNWFFAYILSWFTCTRLKKVTHARTIRAQDRFSVLTLPASAETWLGDLLSSGRGTDAYKCFQQFIWSNCMAWSCHLQENPAKMAIPWAGDISIFEFRSFTGLEFCFPHRTFVVSHPLNGKQKVSCKRIFKTGMMIHPTRISDKQH